MDINYGEIYIWVDYKRNKLFFTEFVKSRWSDYAFRKSNTLIKRGGKYNFRKSYKYDMQLWSTEKDIVNDLYPMKEKYLKLFTTKKGSRLRIKDLDTYLHREITLLNL